MLITRLHKWLFSFALLISLISFSEIRHDQVKPIDAISEVIISKKTNTPTYYVNLRFQNYGLKLHSFCDFNFNQFIKTQELLFSQKEKTQDLVILKTIPVFNPLSFKLISDKNTDDDLYSLIV